MHRISNYVNSWLLGIKFLFFVGLVLVGALFGGALVAVPFILISEMIGYHLDETAWILAGIIVLTPLLLGGAFPVLMKFFSEEM